MADFRSFPCCCWPELWRQSFCLGCFAVRAEQLVRPRIIALGGRQPCYFCCCRSGSFSLPERTCPTDRLALPIISMRKCTLAKFTSAWQRQQAELERKQAELAQRTGELNSELQHRIENMEIHKLMDLVDAPRIMLPIPTPATIAQWAHAATRRGRFSGRDESGACFRVRITSRSGCRSQRDRCGKRRRGPPSIGFDRRRTRRFSDESSSFGHGELRNR